MSNLYTYKGPEREPDRRWIWVTDQFENFHRYENAPDEVAFLKNLHRHIFHVKMWIEVFHDDRELEFFMVKMHYEREIKPFICLGKEVGSCEMIAEQILNALANTYGDDRTYKVEVSEDGENGAIVEYQGKHRNQPSGSTGIGKDDPWNPDF